ncbi:hypothetical protein EV686_1107 [Paracandidimonas soli]|uniref:Uncharacterized protein n=1 Tax=Paracandidimonas soli TaxID=1917182 RepID=A0A4R3URY8_9BURK|nr:hypothetical protein EV686_1107 [Paracandidimonas soli]
MITFLVIVGILAATVGVIYGLVAALMWFQNSKKEDKASQ